MRDFIWLPFGVFVFEMFVALAAPGWLARLARFRVGPTRSVSLSAATALALERPVGGEGGGYREAAARTVDFTRLLAPKVVSNGVKLSFLRERGEILAQPKFDFVRKPRPIVVVALRAESDRIVLEPRFYPSQLVAVAVIALFAAVAVKSAIPLLFFGLFYVIPFFMERHAARKIFDSVEAEVASRVRSLADEPARVRYEERAQGDEPGEDAPAVEEEEGPGANVRR